ncbi:MAG TPA: hypothetical protein VGI40_07870 [Pirellulaceae bacterium]|jgi:hypothetical protein
MFNKIGIVLVIFTLLSVVTACKKSSVKLNPAKGKVLFKDQPAEGALVVFSPAGEKNAQFRGTLPSATVNADGSFEIQTEPSGVGAPAGEYAVLITWFPPRDENPNKSPKNKLPNKYGDAAHPLLKATVNEGENNLEPFNLTP